MKEKFEYRFGLTISLLLIALFVVVIAVQFPNRLFPGDDQAIFLGVADELLRTGSYEFNFRPQTRFPPGVPLLLVYFKSVLPPEMAVQVIMSLSFLIFLVFAFGLFNYYFKSKEAVLLTALLATTPYIIKSTSESLFSDMPFAAMQMVIIYFLCCTPRSVENNKVKSVLLSLLLMSAVMIRSAGIALVVAIVLLHLTDLYRGRGKEKRVVKRQGKSQILRSTLLLVLPAFIADISWRFWTSASRKPFYDGEYMDSYLAQIRLVDPHYPLLGNAEWYQVMLRVPGGVWAELTHAAEAVLRIPWIEPAPASFVVVIFCVILLIGWRQIYLKENSIILYYPITYLGLFGLWPFDEGQRFAYPVMPVLLLLFFKGLSFITTPGTINLRAIKSSRYIALIITTAVLFILSVWTSRGGLQSTATSMFWFASSLVIAGIMCVRHWKFPTLRLVARSPLALVLLLIVIGSWQSWVALNRIKEMDFTKVLHYPSVEAAHFLKNLVLPDEAVMAQQHSIVHYESGIKTIEFPVTADIGLYEELIRAHKVAYLLVLEEPEGPYYFPSQNERLQELVASGEIGLAFIGSGERWVVYQISLLAS